MARFRKGAAYRRPCNRRQNPEEFRVLSWKVAWSSQTIVVGFKEINASLYCFEPQEVQITSQENPSKTVAYVNSVHKSRARERKTREKNDY
ncbi:hypothetical protein ACS0TY_015670 [Phlomoides rotata]